MDLDRRAAGVLLHVTSLPGPHGMGDFGPAAYNFIDWLASAGQRLWQWLPSTPIGPGDSPYQGVSAFAGSQWMVALEPLVERGWLVQPKLPDDGFERSRIDYGRVLPWREAQLRAAANGFFASATQNERDEHEHWCKTQADWLPDYALFMAIRSPRGGQPWWEWPAPLAQRAPEALVRAREQYADEIAFWRFVQWCFDWQCKALRIHARARDVSIVGDLPIFVAHDSADCWSRPDLYFLDKDFMTTVVAGVPPDELGPDGQRWGNPLYRWDRMADEGYAWWAARVKRALDSADVIRIDHFRGFAGYYEIPASSPTAREGTWIPAPGMDLFAAIARELGPLPIIAEDLGLITPDVIALREAYNFPGMKILQFAFGGDGNHEFLPHTYPRRSIVYTGTHDNDTARGWWDNAPVQQQRFAAIYLDADASNVHWKMIQSACNSVSAMALYPMQDVLGLGESHRMNRPGSGDGNWTWRFDWPMVDGSVATRLAGIAATSGRGPFRIPG
ncbi:4-alpha-glucanotransferase [soil metagenome]